MVNTINADVMPRSDYGQVLKAILKEGLCPFCEKNLFRHHSKPILIKTKHWLVTENAWPYEGTKHHFVFIVRHHIEGAEHLTPLMWADLGAAFKKLIKKTKISGGSFVMRNGKMEYTGASVRHLHAQLIVGVQRSKQTEPLKALIGYKRKK